MQNAPAPNPVPAYSGHLKLSFSTGKKVALLKERSFLRKDIPDLFPSTGDPAVAVVRENPNDPSILGLTNCSRTPWNAAMPDGAQRTIDPGKSIKLVPGMTITFGAQTQAQVLPLSSGSAFVSQYGKTMGIGAAAVVLIGVLFLALTRGGSAAVANEEKVVHDAEQATMFIASNVSANSIAQGTGFFITDDGYALTNNHVIADGPKDVKIVMYGQKSVAGHVIKADAKLDVALIKVDAGGPTAYLSIGESKKLEKGETLFAIGYPLGIDNSFTSATVTKGVFSVMVQATTAFHGIPADPDSMLVQTDASINHGNSGGPLIQASTGKVIGIDRLIQRGEEGKQAITGMNYAIPIEEVVQKFLKGTPAEGRTH